MSVDLSVALSQDIGFVSADKPCTKNSQIADGWTCFRPQGDQYHGTPAPGTTLPSGGAAGPTRLLVGLELPFDAIVLGARFGWAFRGIAPPADGQDHARSIGGEVTARLRLAGSSGFRLDLLGLVGARILDAHATVNVTEDRSVPPSTYQLDNPDHQTLDAYKRMGTGFVGIGLAATVPVASWSSLRLELPISLYFPSSGTAVSPTLVWVVTP